MLLLKSICWQLTGGLGVVAWVELAGSVIIVERTDIEYVYEQRIALHLCMYRGCRSQHTLSAELCVECTAYNMFASACDLGDYMLQACAVPMFATAAFSRQPYSSAGAVQLMTRIHELTCAYWCKHTCMHEHLHMPGCHAPSCSFVRHTRLPASGKNRKHDAVRRFIYRSLGSTPASLGETLKLTRSMVAPL